MQAKFEHIALIGKYQSQNSRDLLASIAEFIPKFGVKVSIEAQSAQDAKLESKFPCLELAQICKHCDLVVVAGGDGTMLHAARTVAEFNIPLVGINQGRLGFITDVSPTNALTALEEILLGNYTEDQRSMIQAQVWRAEHAIYSALALNEVVINRGNTSGMVEVRVEVDKSFVASLRADGVIIATPTGSTAYALSSGGPILSPSIKGWVMVPIAPHTLSNRPIVLPDEGTVSMEIVAGKKSSASFDSQSLASLHHKDRVILTKAEQKVRFLHPTNWDYYETLRNKLRWYAE